MDASLYPGAYVRVKHGREARLKYVGQVVALHEAEGQETRVDVRWLVPTERLDERLRAGALAVVAPGEDEEYRHLLRELMQ